MTDRQKLLTELIKIRDGSRLAGVGICGHLKNALPDDEYYVLDELVNDLILKWKKPHDNPVYPVGGMDEYHREQVRRTIWDNPRRWELLHFMIKELETA